VTVRRRAVFLGSGAFAVPVLDALAAAPEVTLVGVVTGPPRQAGRGQRHIDSPVGIEAGRLGLPTLAPERLRAPESVAAVTALAPELLVLADYGQLVPPTLLDLPRHGALNLHPSLLPRHRGAAPIPAAILAGDLETGVTLMRMDAGLDSGPIVAQRRIPLNGCETTPQLEAALAVIAAELLATSLRGWLAGELPAMAQPAEGATLTRPLRREDGRLDPHLRGAELERRVRALQPWPGTFAETDAGRLIVWAAQPVPGPAAEPGTIVADGDGLALGVADGTLRLLEVQLGGGRRMSGAELRRGHPDLAGSRIHVAALG
jgi:methionyl-tRNA formyltransferase